jgi:hypothetical protein
MRTYIARKAAEKFLDKLKSRAPDENEYRSYLDSLHVVQLSGYKGMTAFAVVTDQVKEQLGEILDDTKRRNKTVVYLMLGNDTVIPESAEMLVQHNPWPIFMLPEKVPQGLRSVHRTVNEKEMEWSVEQTQIFIDRYKDDLNRVGLKFSSQWEDETREQESAPDNLTLALRSEFGVAMESRPHWIPALKWLRKHFFEEIRNDMQLRLSVGDWLFRGQYTVSSEEKERLADFNDQYGGFQKKILFHG